jgi:sugar phosphate isomerase/epimerase
MSNQPTRRQLLQNTAALASVATLSMNTQAAEKTTKTAANEKPSFRYCLNTSTIRGQNLPLPETVDLTAKAGYDGIEPWLREIDAFQKDGGQLSDLKKHISDAGLTVESAIAFSKWIVDDETERDAALEQMKRDMDSVRQIGGIRIAAPPVGATNNPNMSLVAAAERYYAVAELGRQMGVKAELELWGFSQFLHRLGELAFVATESGHPNACILPDVYHIYKGGSDFAGLKMINGRSIEVMHMNDYPNIDRATIKDNDRVYPGDGDAPLNTILDYLSFAGFAGTFSLELFNEEYWKQDAFTVAKTGLDKMRGVVAQWQSGRA